MWNLIQPPIKEQTLDSWIKMLDDIAKIAIISVPVSAYSNYESLVKICNTATLILISYCCLIASKFLRNNAENILQREPKFRKEDGKNE